MKKLLVMFFAFLFGVMTGTCTLDVAKGDDFSDLVAQLEAKNAKKPPAKAACTCGTACPCAAGECGDAACPTAAKVAPVYPTRPKPSADEPGNPWQWQPATRLEGGYWWKWKNAPSLGVDPFAAANCANGQCGSQWTVGAGPTYWTSAPAVNEYSNGSGRRGVFRGGFRSGGGSCGAGGCR